MWTRNNSLFKGEGNKKIAPTMSDLWEIAKEIANKQIQIILKTSKRK